MSKAELDLTRSYTEEQYLALETDQRIELIDGKLSVSPGAHSVHQDISLSLGSIFRPLAWKAGLITTPAPFEVRLAPQRIVLPDLVLRRGPRSCLRVEAAEVVLVSEITSPSNASYDRGKKMRFYAEARIPFYLLAEPNMIDYNSVGLTLFRLEGDHYVKHAAAEFGETLVSDVPFPFEIDTEELLGPW